MKNAGANRRNILDEYANKMVNAFLINEEAQLKHSNCWGVHKYESCILTGPIMIQHQS